MTANFWKGLFSKSPPPSVPASRFPNVAFGQGIQVIGLDFIQIGDGSCLGDHCWLNDCLRDGTIRLRIGEKVLLGRRSMVSTAGHLEIGDFCLFGPDCLIADADHVFADIYQPVLQQGATLGRSILIEENCWIGFGAKILGDLVIGRGSTIAAGSIVRKSIPAFSVAVGAPARIVKMYDFGSRIWSPTPDEASLERALENRRRFPPPSRLEYRLTLHQNNRLGALGPELGGAGISF